MQIATVSSAGVVTAITPGAVIIVATSESRTGVAAIAVTAASPAPVAEVRLNVDDEVLLEWNGTTQLSAVALDAQGAELPGRSVQWQTSKPAIATVSDNGSVQAVAAGIATITAIIEGVASNVGVRVKTAPVAEIVLEVPASASALEVGETVFVGTRVKLASGQLVERAMTWTSSNSAVATASSSAPVAAAVEAHAAGDVTLTAAIEGKSASITLRVTPKPTHDLIYNRWNAQNASEIFVLPLDVAGGVPVRLNAGNVSRDPSPSPDGTRLVFAVSQIDPLGRDQNDLYIVNRNGMNMRWLTSMPGVEDEPTWSPDGSKILFHASDGSGLENALWTVNVDGTGLTKLTTSLPAGVSDPRHAAWSPNGSRIAFTAARDGQHKVWTMNADGSDARQVTTDDGFDVGATWSPDGMRIAFSRYNPGVPTNGWDVAIVSAAGGAAVRLSLAGDQLTPAWSPDGNFMAYRSDEAQPERGEIYVRSFKGSSAEVGDGKWRLSKDGVQAMLDWRADGKEVFWRGLNLESNDLHVMSVDVATTPAFSVGTPKLLFKLPGPIGGNLGNISRDGQRFVFAVNVSAATPTTAPR